MDPIFMPWLVARKRQSPKYLTIEPPPKRLPQLSLQPEFKLYSYCPQDMAETTRLILTYAGIDYEDIFIERYHIHRPDLTQWHFPCLEWNGKSVHDNDAIARMLAKMYGLAGNGVFEQAQADILVTSVRDLTDRIRNYLSGLFGMRCFDLEKEFQEIVLPNIHKYYTLLEKYASQSTPNGFFFSSGVTYADFCVSANIEFIKYLYPEVKDRFPYVNSLSQKVMALPQLQSYLTQRPLLKEFPKRTSEVRNVRWSNKWYHEEKKHALDFFKPFTVVPTNSNIV